MKSTDIKKQILRLAESDPDGIGLLPRLSGRKLDASMDHPAVVRFAELLVVAHEAHPNAPESDVVDATPCAEQAKRELPDGAAFVDTALAHYRAMGGITFRFAR